MKNWIFVENDMTSTICDVMCVWELYHEKKQSKLRRFVKHGLKHLIFVYQFLA